MITYEQLNEVVSSVNGTSFAGLTTRTVPKLKGGKKNPMQGRVTKLTEDANVIIYSNSEKSGYADMVKRRMVAEGKNPETFELKPRAWGTRVGKSPFIQHNDKYYFECMFISPGKTSYFLDGEHIAKEDVEGLPESKEKEEKPEEIGRPFRNEDLENKVVIRTFGLDSIVSIKIKNEVLNA